MDADDISELNSFERQIQYFDEHSKGRMSWYLGCGDNG